MDGSEPDAVIWGFNAAGRKFRPSDWSERLAGLTAAFGEQGAAYLPLVRPVAVGDATAVVVGARLRTMEPRLYHFFVQFARDNALVLEFRAGALDAPHALVPPRSPARSSAEPQEPV